MNPNPPDAPQESREPTPTEADKNLASIFNAACGVELWGDVEYMAKLIARHVASQLAALQGERDALAKRVGELEEALNKTRTQLMAHGHPEDCIS